MTTEQTKGPFFFLPIDVQIEVLKERVSIIAKMLDAIKPIAATLPHPRGDQGIITVINPSRWQEMHIAVAIGELMAISGLELYSHGIHIVGHAGEFPAEKFTVQPKTQAQYQLLTQTQSPDALTFQARWDLGMYESGPNEFDLSLSSTIWVLLTHWNQLSKDKLLSGVKIACAGTRFSVSASADMQEQLVPEISFSNNRLNIDYVSFEKAGYAYKIVGVL